MQDEHTYLIGIDEAGRGPLAGPVVVGGIRINSKFKNQNAKFRKIFVGIKDSKKLTPRQREKWFGLLTTRPVIGWAFAKVWPRVIDRINIARAADLGAQRVYKKLARGKILPAVLDGSLYLSKKVPHRTIPKGDENIPVIAAASIIAKVIRDRTMLRLHKKYPQYRFDKHKGYGTKLHVGILKELGSCKWHRKSFLSRII